MFDVDDFDFDDLDRGPSGDPISRPGFYELEVQRVVDETDAPDKTPCFRFDCVVTRSMDGQDELGSILWHRVYVGQREVDENGNHLPPKPGAIKVGLKFARGLGLVARGPKGEVVDAETGEKPTDEMWIRAEGRKFVTKLVERDGGYDGVQINYGQVWDPDDPAVAHIVGRLTAEPNPPAAADAAAQASSTGTGSFIDDPDL